MLSLVKREEKKRGCLERRRSRVFESLCRDDSYSLSINRHGDWPLEVGCGFTSKKERSLIHPFTDIGFFLLPSRDRRFINRSAGCTKSKNIVVVSEQRYL